MAAALALAQANRLINVAVEFGRALGMRMISFMQDPGIAHGLDVTRPGNGNWVGLRTLGHGGFGILGLWGFIDANHNRLRHRVVYKEVQCEASSWYDPLAWTGARDANGDRDYDAAMVHTEHVETGLHRRMRTNRPASVVGLRGQHVDAARWRYQVLLDYCPYGDLNDIIRVYQDNTRFPNNQDTPIPEPFIWYVFEQLVKAVQVMEHGNEDNTRVAGWREIIHRDIKPGNVFLCDPPAANNAAADWKLYPRPVLGDFGLAVDTSDTDPNNSRAYQISGTPGFKAAEQLMWVRPNSRTLFERERLSSATNVWAIGMVIFCLVYRERRPNQPPFIPGQPQTQTPHSNKARPPYSWSLTDLMDDCLKMEPSERPSMNMILARIRPPGLDADDLHFKGMRRIKPELTLPWWDVHQRGCAHRLYYMDLRDRWAVGKVRGQLGH